MSLPHEQLRGKPPTIDRPPVTGRVTKVDTQGVWVVPIDGDLRTPVGPCRGPSDIPVGTVVMVIYTQERPWVFGAELLTVLNADVRDLTLLEAAAADAQALLDAHAADTTAVHGIADTSELETQIGAQEKANAAALASQRELVTITLPGAATVATGTLRHPIGTGTWAITSVRATAGTAPVGAALLVDVNKNGATIYGTPGNRPSIAAGANAGAGGAPSVATVTAGDYLTVDVDQVGSTTPGADLVVAIRLTRTA